MERLSELIIDMSKEALFHIITELRLSLIMVKKREPGRVDLGEEWVALSYALLEFVKLRY